MKPLITHSDLQAIWEQHDLGAVLHVQQPARGGANQCLFVNQHYVIRFESHGGQHTERFQNEAMAYQELANTDVPVPEVLVLETSQALVPYTYLITTRMDGQPIIESWSHLSLSQRYRVAHQMGHYLALIQHKTFPRFGRLALLNTTTFGNWYSSVIEHLERNLRQEMALSLRFGPEIVSRLWAVFSSSRALLEAVQPAVLLHSDYHFENIVQRRGHLTGIVDFEWAMTGDSAWDFTAEDTWEANCPGSKAWIYEGYQQQRPLESSHRQRVLLYKIMLHLEAAVTCQQKEDITGYRQVVERLTNEIAKLEAVL